MLIVKVKSKVKFKRFILVNPKKTHLISSKKNKIWYLRKPRYKVILLAKVHDYFVSLQMISTHKSIIVLVILSNSTAWYATQLRF